MSTSCSISTSIADIDLLTPTNEKRELSEIGVRRANEGQGKEYVGVAEAEEAGEEERQDM